MAISILLPKILERPHLLGANKTQKKIDIFYSYDILCKANLFILLSKIVNQRQRDRIDLNGSCKLQSV